MVELNKIYKRYGGEEFPITDKNYVEIDQNSIITIEMHFYINENNLGIFEISDGYIVKKLD